MADEIDRRMALALGSAAFVAGALPAAEASAAASRPVAGVVLFDPTSPEARALANDAHGQKLVAVAGDPVRLWRAQLAQHRGPVRGVTRWSDYLVLRGMAEEQGFRLRHEQRVETPHGAMIVEWIMG